MNTQESEDETPIEEPRVVRGAPPTPPKIDGMPPPGWDYAKARRAREVAKAKAELMESGMYNF